MLNGKKSYILVRYGELSTKGKNRKEFVKLLRQNIKRALKGIECSIEAQYNRIYISLEGKDVDSAVEKLKHIFGIASFSVGYEVGKSLDEMKQCALEIMNSIESKTFKVETKRRDKTFGIDSDHINRELASHILKNSDYKVDVKHPDVRLKVEVEEADRVFLMGHTYQGALGYPVGVQGKVMMLLSGGIDSPVASYMLMKRGCQLEFIHFASMPYTSQNALDKVKSLAQQLTKYQVAFKLHIVPFTQLQLKIYEKADESYAITLMRRYMVRLAQRLAEINHCKAIASGESLGQVASQTIESISVINQAISMVMLRPLIGFEKNDIIRISKEIDTYETSILPFEDCCTIFTPQAPVTKPKLEKVERYESRLEVDELLDQIIAETETIYIDAHGQEEIDLF